MIRYAVVWHGSEVRILFTTYEGDCLVEVVRVRRH